MEEFADERRLLQATLSRDTLVDTYVWELSQGAATGTVVHTSLSRIQQSDIAIFLFGLYFGQVTVEEFNSARAMGIPCLVYITESSEGRNPILQEFLDKHILDPRRGLTYFFFRDIVQLLEIIPRDLRQHLVLAYRSASRTMPTGALSTALRLASDVSTWQHFHDDSILEREQTVLDRRTIDLVFRKRVSTKRGYLQEHFVRCIAGIVDAEDVVAFQKDHSDLDGLLVSDGGFTAAALGIATTVEGRAVATLDEFIERQVDFSAYIESVESSIRDRGIHDGWMRMRCTESALYAGINPSVSLPPVDLESFVEGWLKDPTKEHLTIIGEFGSGKSWALQHLAYLTIGQYREARERRTSRPRMPIFVELRETRTLPVEQIIDAILSKFNLPPGAIETLNRMGKILFMFDGFDEMSARIDHETLAKHYWQLARVLVPGGKLLLTCRSEHFPNPMEGRQLLRGELRDSAYRLSTIGPQFQVIELQRLSEEEVRLWFERRVGADRAESLLAVPELADICRRPLMLELISDAGMQLGRGRLTDYARVLMLAIRGKLERDFHESRSTTSVIDRFLFLTELAWWMLERELSSFSAEAIQQIISFIYPPAKDQPADIEVMVREMVGQTLLVHASQGEFRFSHLALFEFCIAFKFVAKLGTMSEEYLEFVRDPRPGNTSIVETDMGWTEYVSTRGLPRAPAEIAIGLRRFTLDFGERETEENSFIDANMFSRNTFVLAAGMIDREPAAIERICLIALEGTSKLAWNVQCLLPFLKGKDSAMLAETIVHRSGGGPVKRGVAWALGELGVASEPVIRALRLTVESLGKPGGSAPEDWAKAAFALEKLGVLGKSEKHRSDEAAGYLIQNLPEGYTSEQAYRGLMKSFSSKPTEPSAIVNQCDVLALVKFKEAFASRELKDLFSGLDYSKDAVGRRIFYAVWLIGHIGLFQFATNLVQATRHPHGSVRNCACEALGKLGCREQSMVRALEESLADKYYRVRHRAAWALKELGSQASLPLIIEAAAREEVPEIAAYMKQVIVGLKQTSDS